jgi:hypothetical protein
MRWSSSPRSVGTRGKVDAEREHPLNEPCDGDPLRVLGPHAERHATGEWDGSLSWPSSQPDPTARASDLSSRA